MNDRKKDKKNKRGDRKKRMTQEKIKIERKSFRRRMKCRGQGEIIYSKVHRGQKRKG